MVKILYVLIFLLFMVTSICIVNWENYILYPTQYSVMESSFFKSGVIAFILGVGWMTNNVDTDQTAPT